jgi:hypothetical protein
MVSGSFIVRRMAEMICKEMGRFGPQERIGDLASI